MKPHTPTSPLMVAILIAMGAAAHLSAQTVEFISVEKISNYIRNKDGVFLRVFDAPTQSFPYQFRIDVEGSDIPLATFLAPAGSSYELADPPADGGNHGLLFAGDDGWSRTFSFGSKGPTLSGYPGGTGPHPAGLDGVFHNGEYVVSALGEDVTLQLGGDADADAYPGAPNPTVSAGTWDAGGIIKLYHNVNNPLTINTGTFANFGTDVVVSGLNLFVDHNGSELINLFSLSSDLLGLGLSNGTFTDFLEYTFAANTMVSGTDYYVSIEFFNLTDAQQVAGLDGALAVAMFTTRTQFIISAVPEPSTYAAIAGALALVGVMVVRRRRI
ncbi:MAG: PEP-CTERM sorting domain-containing protein [Opitutaceae bacterium]|nr:PEP-CTERM sorting domain-containing protein [Opitutaceae bacterium]